MKQQLVIFILASFCVVIAKAAICFAYNGGFFYTGAAGLTCKEICADHGGFNADYTRHTGNAVGMHFYPTNANSGVYKEIECSAKDDNYGANGGVPNQEFYEDGCRLSCACNYGTDDCEGTVCSNLISGDSCSFRYYLNDAAAYANGTCGGDGGDCYVPCTDPCLTEAYLTSKGKCVGTPKEDSTACSTDSINIGCGQCLTGVCTTSPINTSCNDGNGNTCNDVCSESGICSGSECIAPVATPGDVPISEDTPVANAPASVPGSAPVTSAPVKTPVGKSNSGSVVIPAVALIIAISMTVLY